MARHPLYPTWRGMHMRCTNPTNKSFRYYGAKGIAVCDRWGAFQNFVEDMAPRPEGTTLDRIDSLLSYSPDNCRWATRQEQNNRKSDNVFLTYKGKTQTAGRWAKELGLSPQTIHHRFRVLLLPVELVLGLPADRWATRRQIK